MLEAAGTVHFQSHFAEEAQTSHSKLDWQKISKMTGLPVSNNYYDNNFQSRFDEEATYKLDWQGSDLN